jgi:hypothetical protein
MTAPIVNEASFPATSNAYVRFSCVHRVHKRTVTTWNLGLDYQLELLINPFLHPNSLVVVGGDRRWSKSFILFWIFVCPWKVHTGLEGLGTLLATCTILEKSTGAEFVPWVSCATPVAASEVLPSFWSGQLTGTQVRSSNLEGSTTAHFGGFHWHRYTGYLRAKITDVTNLRLQHYLFTTGRRVEIVGRRVRSQKLPHHDTAPRFGEIITTEVGRIRSDSSICSAT